MNTKQLLAELERGIKALQKAHALVLKAESVALKGKVTAAKTAPAMRGKTTKVPATKVVKGVMSAEGRARVAAAQHKRWAKVRREKSRAAKAGPVVRAAA